MTVCIATIADMNLDDRKIILCADRKISGALGSAETMMKVRNLGKGWRALTAGADFDITSGIRLLKSSLSAAPQTIDETNILPLVRNALNSRMREKVDELIQGKFAISYREFLDFGKARLPDDIFRNAMTEVELLTIEAEFIIVGFANGFPLLLKTDQRGGAVIKEDFTSIGEGSYLAHASLLNRKYQDMMPFSDAVYCVYEAKKFAEGAPTVGQETTLVIVHNDGRHELLNPSGHAFLEKKYSSLGRHNISSLTMEPNSFTALNPW